MSIRTHKAARPGLNWTLISALIVTVGIAVVIAANAHLVHVALQSQPDCVPHAKQQADEPGIYRAAQSAC